ncbi:hypothetical protein G7046_g702 [Stylonectria norvegica]|nr:hypothetical protein G7046_g702 [Stylonectria norvegica]
MKASTVSLVLSALGSYATAVDLATCKAVAPSCRYVEAASAKWCSSIISAQNIAISSCRHSQLHVTKTQTSRPTVTSTRTIHATTTTKVITSISTSRGSTITLPPATIAVIATATTTETTTYTSYGSTKVTSTEIDIEESSTTIIATETSLSLAPYSPPHCAVPDKRDADSPANEPSHLETTVEFELHELFDASDGDVSHPSNMFHRRRRDASLPSDCSCYLTSTKLDLVPQTTTVTVTLKSTHTSTKILGGTAPTITTTSTVKKTTVVPGTTVSQSTSYSTSTTTLTSTETESTTSIHTNSVFETTISTTILKSTTTTTQVAVATDDPCSPNNIGQLTRFNVNLYPDSNVKLGSTQEITGGALAPTYCCQNCYTSHDCVFWSVDYSTGACNGYFSSANAPVARCPAPGCSKGFPSVLAGSSDGHSVYGVGPCSGGFAT